MQVLNLRQLEDAGFIPWQRKYTELNLRQLKDAKVARAATVSVERRQRWQRWQECQSGTGGKGAKVPKVRRQRWRRLRQQRRQKLARWRRPPSNSFRATATRDPRQARYRYGWRERWLCGRLEVTESDFTRLETETSALHDFQRQDAKNAGRSLV